MERVAKLLELAEERWHQPAEVLFLSPRAAEVAAAHVVRVREVERRGGAAGVAQRAQRAGGVHASDGNARGVVGRLQRPALSRRGDLVRAVGHPLRAQRVRRAARGVGAVAAPHQPVVVRRDGRELLAGVSAAAAVRRVLQQHLQIVVPHEAVLLHGEAAGVVLALPLLGMGGAGGMAERQRLLIVVGEGQITAWGRRGGRRGMRGLVAL
mmetsp:Transcript_42264/g.105264  ORF Transcript_42264/g.105264 Transcript_42264/m.105264 type:complete len:210 (+) Transcript_42264:622-1251(+)